MKSTGTAYPLPNAQDVADAQDNPPTHPSRVTCRCAHRISIGGLVVIVALVVGCGRSQSDDSAVVSPPSPAPNEPAPTDREPPGGLEMPEVEMPEVDVAAPRQQTSPGSSGGLEMPQDVTLPEDRGAEDRGAEDRGAEDRGAEDRGASATPKVLYGTWAQVDQFAKTSGRITVVDLWSLACEPCLKEFPGLVRLHQQRGEKVQCIALNLDFDGRKTRPPDYYEERVAAFLRSVGATGFPIFISQTPSDDIYSNLKLASIPAVLVYGADGEVVEMFVDAGETAGFTYEDDVIPLVAKLAG